MVIAYIISFYNQSNRARLSCRFALIHTINFFVIILLYYMLVNLVDDEANLRKTIGFFMVSTALVTFILVPRAPLPRQGHPAQPHLFDHKVSLVMKDIRVKGPFHDYELLAQFFAMNVPILILMVVRSRRLLVRFMYILLLVFVLFMQFATITRGAFISLIIGIVYMTWICRKDLNIVQFTGLAAASVGCLVAIDTIMSRYTISGLALRRGFSQTTIEQRIHPGYSCCCMDGRGESMAACIRSSGTGPDGISRTRLEERALAAQRLSVLPQHLRHLRYGSLSVRALSAREGIHDGSCGSPSSRLPFPRALMKVLHVCLVIFIIDMIKVDYQRNDIYMYFVWILFALISAARTIIDASVEPAQPVSRV